MIRKTIIMASIAAPLIGISVFADAQDLPKSEPQEAGTADQSGSASESVSEQRERQLEERVKQLEKKLEAMSAQMESDSEERLAEEAQNEARAAPQEQTPEQRKFLEGGLALQKLNPELTFTGDILAGLVIEGSRFYAGETDRSGMPVRGVGIHFQHALDPYSIFKSALHFAPEHGAGVEEVYVSWFGLIPSFSLTVGRFRQNFGIVNRWHEHALDQSQHPLAMRLILGDEGLVGNGFMIKWLMPALWAHANELTLEVVDGENDTLFAGEYFSIPSSMLHLKNYYDLSASTYLELGLTAMLGFNNKRGLLTDDDKLEDEPWRRTLVGGADLTLYWSPLQRAKYQSFTWRSEFYYANKKLPRRSSDRYRSSWGAYSYLQYQLAERWFCGLRGDVALPTIRENDRLAWDIVPYLTFWQSEYVYLRLEYQHGRRIPYTIGERAQDRRTDNRVLLQLDFAAGPHKHEKY